MDVLDSVIINFSDRNGSYPWTIRNAIEGVQIFGGIGSGKTSGSARTLALKYLKNGFGGLVLTVKKEERENWVEYCRLTGRSNDLIIVEPNGKYHFNFLEYENANNASSKDVTDNIVQVLKTVIRASEEKSSGKNDDPFWETALDMLIFHVIDLCKLAYNKVSVKDMFDIVQSIPRNGDLENQPAKKQNEPDKPEEKNAFVEAIKLARANTVAQINEWQRSLTVKEQNELNQSDAFDSIVLDKVPAARIYHFLNYFFFENYIKLSDKTRSIIDFSFSGFLFRLLREPIYSLLCKGSSTFSPEDSLHGKIILIDLPVKHYNKIGRDCQILFKYIWQRAMEKRDIQQNNRPVFLWADEAQHFLHEHDAEYQATARSSRIATVYISQNLPNYYANMGGNKADHRVKSFLGTLGTKIFHANADIETNRYSSELIGDNFFESTIKIRNVFGKAELKKETINIRIIKPEEFARLKTGGQQNQYKVRAYIHVQGSLLASKQNFIGKEFDQNFQI